MTTTILSRLSDPQRCALMDISPDILEELALRLAANLSGESGNPKKAILAINYELEEMGHRHARIAQNC